MQTYIDTLSSVKQFLGRNRNINSDVHIYVRYGNGLNKRTYSIPNNRYERYLNKLRGIAWNEMTKTCWNELLSNFGNVIFGKIDKDDSNSELDGDNEMNTDDDSQSELGGDNNEPVNIKIDINMNVNVDINMNETNTDKVDKASETSKASETKLNTNKEFSTKRELYDYYGIDMKSIPDGYEIKMRYVKTNGKMGRLYKLVKK